MEPIQLSPTEARKIILHAAGLSQKAQFGTGIEAVYRLIDHLGFVQLDTNYVVERAHHHVMAARIPDYEPAWLGELTDEGRILNISPPMPALCRCASSGFQFLLKIVLK